MAPQTHSYRDSALNTQERTGGPRRPQSGRVDRVERYLFESSAGSHMPLDTGIHWTWRNPLNIIPALLLLFALIGIVGMLV